MPRARETTTTKKKKPRVFKIFDPHPSSQTVHDKPEGSGWINLEQVAGQTGQADAGEGLCLPLCAGEKSIAPRPRRAAPASQTSQRVQRDASNTLTHKSTSSPEDAGPPRRGQEPSDDAAQLRRDAAST